MITAQELTKLTTLTPGALTTMIREAGYPRDKFNTATFLGITNAGQFCYSATYTGIEGEEDTIKVFVSKHPYGSLEADY